MQKQTTVTKLIWRSACDLELATLTRIIRLFHQRIWMCWLCHNNT